ncbi:MAG: hypothetical protein MJE77_20340 [Proteobacteria bacterium]|nr:hypothetical protein [Pseudomonadota bacterium]
MTRLSNSPLVQKGAIVAIDPLVPIPTVIAFQYNPETMSRSLQPDMAGDGGSKSEALRIENPPKETIKLKAEFDATDGLETSDAIAVSMGVYPQLSSLEKLLYPPSLRVIANMTLAATGIIEVIPPAAPFTLFVWGPKRVLPVQLESLTIEETAYDERLNPIQAKADLSLRVLSYSDFSVTDPGTFVFLTHQVVKEVMSAIATANSIASIF